MHPERTIPRSRSVSNTRIGYRERECIARWFNDKFFLNSRYHGPVCVPPRLPDPSYLFSAASDRYDSPHVLKHRVAHDNSSSVMVVFLPISPQEHFTVIILGPRTMIFRPHNQPRSKCSIRPNRLRNNPLQPTKPLHTQPPGHSHAHSSSEAEIYRTGIQAHQDVRLVTCFPASHSVVLCEQRIVRWLARDDYGYISPTLYTERTPYDPSFLRRLGVCCLRFTRFTLPVSGTVPPAFPRHYLIMSCPPIWLAGGRKITSAPSLLRCFSIPLQVVRCSFAPHDGRSGGFIHRTRIRSVYRPIHDRGRARSAVHDIDAEFPGESWYSGTSLFQANNMLSDSSLDACERVAHPGFLLHAVVGAIRDLTSTGLVNATCHVCQ